MLEKFEKKPKSPVLPGKNVRLHWKPASLHGRFPISIRPWLSDRSSLTAKLKQQCASFHVQRLFEGWDTPLPSEQQKLKLTDGQQVWTRCVLLLCNQQPIVYARTLIPHFSAGNPWLNLQHLGNRPLGEWLFQLPNLKRSPFEFAQTQLRWPYLPTPIESQSTYARRCLFQQNQAPLLLTEVFLKPELDH
ncbi:chorismate--pyruvate lyase family protein [Galenea microaerophila]